MLMKLLALLLLMHRTDIVFAIFQNSTEKTWLNDKKEVVSDDDRMWYEKIPIPPIAVATSRTLPDGVCKRQLTKYIQELQKGTLWAFQMYDASAKQPYGIIDGQTRHLGSFDQCYRINVDLSGREKMQGRYCLVDYKYEQRKVHPPFKGKLEFDFNPQDSVWEAVREKGDFRRIRRYMLQLAICIPATCTAQDVQEALRGPYEDFGKQNNLVVNVSIDENNCQAYHEEKPFTTGGYVFCTLIFMIFMLVVVATLYDGTLITEEEKNGTSPGRQLLLCFSAKRNLHTIFEVSYKHRGLDTIHFIRFYLMCLVITGHRVMQFWFNTTVNESDLEKTFYKRSVTVTPNGTIVVDAFLAIGGLLTCYGLLHLLDKTKRMNFIFLTLTRLFRLTPVYALFIFFTAYIFPHLGSGPHWKWFIGVESDDCATTWWANLLYLNNYFTMDRTCMFQSWYLSVDFHSYMISICLIYAFWKFSRKIGYSILGVATLISIIVTFYVTYTRRIQPIYIGFPYLKKLKEDPYFVNYYVKSHLRMTAYFVGVIGGAILYDYQQASWRISKPTSQILFIFLVFVLSFYAYFLGLKYQDPNANVSPLETALYASLHRGAYAASYCFTILLITMGDGLDFYYNFLTPRWVQPLGRLTYSVLIIHPIIQSYQVGTVRTARTFGINYMFWDSVLDIIYSFSIALLIAVGIEGPFRKMEKYFTIKREKLQKNKIENHKSK